MPTVSGVVTDSEGNTTPWSASWVTAAAPGPDSWHAAFASRDMRGTQPQRDPAEPIGAIRAWYDANTGHDPSLAYAPAVASGTWTITSTWLNANLGNGRVSFVNGRWLVERYTAPGLIRFQANNVTLRNVHQLNTSGSLYGLQSRTTDGNASGIVVERSTLNGNYDDNASSAAINFNAATEPDQITIRHCEIFGYRAGIYCFAGITAEYCWVHDLNFTATSHNTPASIRGGNVHLRRNLLADGNSSALSFYPEVGPYTGIVAEENIFRLQASDTGMEVILAENRAFSELLPGQTRILRNNLFYRGGNRGEGGGISGGARGGLSEISGNVDRMGEAVT